MLMSSSWSLTFTPVSSGKQTPEFGTVCVEMFHLWKCNDSPKARFTQKPKVFDGKLRSPNKSKSVKKCKPVFFSLWFNTCAVLKFSSFSSSDNGREHLRRHRGRRSNCLPTRTVSPSRIHLGGTNRHQLLNHWKFDVTRAQWQLESDIRAVLSLDNHFRSPSNHVAFIFLFSSKSVKFIEGYSSRRPILVYQIHRTD
jgi:hypothetical protein